MDRSKIGKSSRNKGARYERKVCQILTELTGENFRRAPRSGALMRDGKVNGEYISGDLICEKRTKFSIECKNRKSITLDNALKNLHTSKLVEAWHQCNFDAGVASELPMLFFHMLQKDFIGLCKHGIDLFEHQKQYFYIHLETENPFSFTVDNRTVALSLPNIYIVTIDEFIQFDHKRMFTWDADVEKNEKNQL